MVIPPLLGLASLLVGVITFDLPGMGGPTSSKLPPALLSGSPRKPHHYVKVGMPLGGALYVRWALSIEKYSSQIKSVTGLMKLAV
jgi:hypothetical protein